MVQEKIAKEIVVSDKMNKKKYFLRIIDGKEKVGVKVSSSLILDENKVQEKDGSQETLLNTIYPKGKWILKLFKNNEFWNDEAIRFLIDYKILQKPITKKYIKNMKNKWVTIQAKAYGNYLTRDRLNITLGFNSSRNEYNQFTCDSSQINNFDSLIKKVEENQVTREKEKYTFSCSFSHPSYDVAFSDVTVLGYGIKNGNRCIVIKFGNGNIEYLRIDYIKQIRPTRDGYCKVEHVRRGRY